MYLEIKDLTLEEKTAIKGMFGDRIRNLGTVYDEVCRIEADCSIERVLEELEIELSKEEIEKAIEEIAKEIAYACEDRAFQEMCEIADELARAHFA